MGHLVMGTGRGGLGQEVWLLSHKYSIKEEEPCDFGPASLDLGTILSLAGCGNLDKSFNSLNWFLHQ